MAEEFDDGDSGIGSGFTRNNNHGNLRRDRAGGYRGGRSDGGTNRNFAGNGENGYNGNHLDRNFNGPRNGSRGDREGDMEGAFGGGRRDNNIDRSFTEYKDDKPKEFYIPPEPSTDEREIFNTGIASGLNFKKYDKIPVKVTGQDAPHAITSFRESKLCEFLLKNVEKSGYTEPTPIQKTAIPIIMAKRDLMACAQTGSGKTAAFILPILNTLLSDSRDLKISKPHVVIVSPTRELAIQISTEVRKFAYMSLIKTVVIYGGTATRYQSGLLMNGCHVLVATPGRLLDFVDRGYISFEDVRFVVLDEADRMLDMGFMPTVQQIMNHPTMVKEHQRQTLMFSATFPQEIQVAAGTYLNNYVFVAIGIVGGACADVQQTIYEVKKYNKRDKLIEILNESDPSGTIVFVETKRDADFLASFLSETEHPTTSIHGDREQRQREEALKDFISGRMKVLIATSVAARGLDIKTISHVINYNLPKHIDDYVHRIGRTGRVGNTGRATSFFEPDEDVGIAESLKKILEQAGQTVPPFLSNYSSGGGASGGRSNFGGRDVRQPHRGNVPSKQEVEEEW